MTRKEVDLLIQKYLDAETSPQEELLLALEVTRPDAPTEWRIVAEMLGQLTVDEALYASPRAGRYSHPDGGTERAARGVRACPNTPGPNEQREQSRACSSFAESRGRNTKRQRGARGLPRRVWPWIAAACVAVVIAIALIPRGDPRTPQEPTHSPLFAIRTAEVAQLDNSPSGQAVRGVSVKICHQSENLRISPNPPSGRQGLSPAVERAGVRQPAHARGGVSLERKNFQPAQSVGSVKETDVSEGPRTTREPTRSPLFAIRTAEVAQRDNPPSGQPALPVPHHPACPEVGEPPTLTERDIPITRPENWELTAEEVALMKRQANEAYLKWMELEMAIARFNMEQANLK